MTTQQIVDAISREIDAHAEEKKTSQNPLPPDNSLWWFQFFVVIFTGVLAIVGVFQAILIFGTLKATQNSANAAKQSADLAARNMIIDQRAWIGLDTINVLFEVEKHISFIATFTNTGKTPAKNSIIRGKIEILESDTPPDFTYVSGVEPKSKAIITPMQKLTGARTTKEPLSKTLFNDVTTGKTRIYFHGIVNYDDIFGKHHWITFCAFIAENGKFCKAYKEHNDTDDIENN